MIMLLTKNPSFDRDMKIQVYICVADIVLGSRDKSKPYLDKLIHLAQVGFQGCVALTKQVLLYIIIIIIG